jgi:hypothetical protein
VVAIKVDLWKLGGLAVRRQEQAQSHAQMARELVAARSILFNIACRTKMMSVLRHDLLVANPLRESYLPLLNSPDATRARHALEVVVAVILQH